MNIEKEIKINLFAQGLCDINLMKDDFNLLDVDKKRSYLHDLVILIIQSKPITSDIETAILDSKLKHTFTPCVMLKKGIERFNLLKITELPINELEKSFILLIHLFKTAYLRRFEKEKNVPNKWWYWDFSDETNYNRLDLLRKGSIQ